MRVGGTKSFDAPRAVVWEVLNDPERMAKLMPGVESFDVQDERHWRANVKVPLGMGGLRMSFSFEKMEEREPEYARLHAKGNGVGAIVSMDTRFDLAEAGAGTEMKWEADVRIAGPVGSMGQRVIQPIVNQQVGNVLTALEKQVDEAHAGAERGPEARGSEPQTGSAASGGGTGASGSEPQTSPAPGEPLLGAADPSEPMSGPVLGGAAEGVGEAGGGTGEGQTDPELKDSGPPAGGVADPEGSSGAEEGLAPWAPESYSDDPDGPTTSTDEPR